MKKNSIRLSFLLSMVLLGSCKKQLDLLPTDSIPPARVFSSVADLQQGLEGAYELNAGAVNAVLIGSILADEVRVGSSNHGDGIVSFEWQYTPNDETGETEFLSDFAAYYTMINAINEELASIGNVAPKNATETTTENRIRGELIALRGIAHFEVLIRFMSVGYDSNSLGVPIMLQPDLLGQPARARVGDVIHQVNTDLATGASDTDIPDAPDDVTSLSHASIAAYQARVALLTHSWSNVVSFAKLALTQSGKALDSSQFAAYWSDANESETLWKYRNQATPQLFWTNPDGTISIDPSDKLIEAFDTANDIRYSAYFAHNASSADTTLIHKYPGSALGPQVNDVKLVRVAELYLDLAEAYAQLNDLTAAADTLNQLRAARIKGYAPIVFTDQQSAIQAVSNERLKELCFEGFRFFDLKRNAAPINRLPPDVQSNEWLVLPSTDHRFALPIPQHEIFANKNMVQNPGY